MPKIAYKNKAGVRLSGVTTIIGSNLGWNKQSLMAWAFKQGQDGKEFRETTQAACDSGTICHQMVEADLKGKEFKMPDVDKDIILKAETAYKAWLEWKDVVGVKMIESEKSLVHEELGFGGTIDIASVKKVTAIVDIKTSNDVYVDHRIQVSAYGQLWNYNYPDNPIQAYYILRLGKNDGGFAYYYWPSLDREWQAFLCLLKLHNLKKEIA